MALYIILIVCVITAFILANSRMRKEAKKKTEIESEKIQEQGNIQRKEQEKI
ncbi:MAG: hypothetical protein RSD26_07645 [Cellulosilyticaceae bacterium]